MHIILIQIEITPDGHLQSRASVHYTFHTVVARFENIPYRTWNKVSL